MGAGYIYIYIHGFPNVCPVPDFPKQNGRKKKEGKEKISRSTYADTKLLPPPLSIHPFDVLKANIPPIPRPTAPAPAPDLPLFLRHQQRRRWTAKLPASLKGATVSRLLIDTSAIPSATTTISDCLDYYYYSSSSSSPSSSSPSPPSPTGSSPSSTPTTTTSSSSTAASKATAAAAGGISVAGERVAIIVGVCLCVMMAGVVLALALCIRRWWRKGEEGGRGGGGGDL